MSPLATTSWAARKGDGSMRSAPTEYADRFVTDNTDASLLEDPSFLRAYGLGRGERLADFLERRFSLNGRRVLDLGAGYGALAVPLEGRGARVVAMDISEHRLRVARYRGKMAIGAPLRVAQGDAFKSPALPFADQSFDVVIINGVLEYAGLAEGINPEQVQANVLREAHRLLTPNGWVYWAIENRYSITYLYGPGHDGLLWSSLLPRRMAGWYSHLIKGHPYRMCEPSYFQLRALLRQAGFRAIQVYGGVMNYNNFTHVIDLESRQDSPIPTSRGLRAAALYTLFALRLQRYLWPNFMAIAQK